MMDHDGLTVIRGRINHRRRIKLLRHVASELVSSKQFRAALVVLRDVQNSLDVLPNPREQATINHLRQICLRPGEKRKANVEAGAP